MKKCILVGHGYWGTILERYLEGAGFETAYIYTSGCEKSFEDVLAETKAEAVFICTPVSTHFDYVRRALQAGVHVFCEKMLTGDASAAADLFELADQTGTILFTDYIYLYSPSIRKAGELCSRVSPIKSIRARITQYGKFYKDTDVTGNIGVHMISSAGFLTDFKEPEDINVHVAADGKGPEDGQSPEYGQILDEEITCRIDDAEVHIHASIISDEKARYICITGENGDIVFDMMKTPSLTARIRSSAGEAAYPEEVSFSFDEMNNLTNSLSAFCQSIDDPKGYEYTLNRRCSAYVEAFTQCIYL